MAILAIVFIAVALVVLLLLPKIVHDRAVATARDWGFAVTIDRTGIGFGGVSLRGIKASALRAGLSATVQEIFIEGLSGKNVRIVGLDAKIDGSYADLAIPIGMLLAEDRARFAGDTNAPRHLTLAKAHLTAAGLLGAGSTIEARDVGLELDSRGSGLEELRGSAGQLAITTGDEDNGRHLGPWASSFESAPTGARVRVMFDPPIADGPSALFVVGRLAPLEVTVKIPRSSFTHLGFKPDENGIPADAATEVEVNLEGRLPLSGRSEVKGDVTLWAARPKGFPAPIDIRADVGLAGASDGPLSFEKTTVTLGPFVAGVTGTVLHHDRGLRLDAMFKTNPVPCERFAKAEAKKVGPLTQVLQALGQSTGAVRVTGSVNASGVVKYDSAAPNDASVTWLAKETCGVSIFGM
jgi:hypothetical protein